MDDDEEGALHFDFEDKLDVGHFHPTESNPVSKPPDAPPSTNSNTRAVCPSSNAAENRGTGTNQRRSFRQTVCRHWLRSLCMLGDACPFLHRYGMSRMPVCRDFRLHGECGELDCIYKHTNENVNECDMYKLGFCPNGPNCRYRHVKLPGPPPPVQEVLQMIQQHKYVITNRFFQNQNYAQQPVHNGTNQVSTSIQQQASQVPDGQQNQASRTAATPLPQGTSRYFIVKSDNSENLELSVQQGVWATQQINEGKLNEAFDSVDNVILIFSINGTSHFQGCAKMTSKIDGSVGGGNWKHGHYGQDFSVKWLKLCELHMYKTRHLHNPYNDNLSVKSSRDCQEVEPSVGKQLASLLYLEPDSDLMAVWVSAEPKREGKKAKRDVCIDYAPSPRRHGEGKCFC